MLEYWGCRCAEAAEGEGAFSLLKEAVGQQDPFRIVIMDMMIPGLSSEYLGGRIKADDALKDTLLVMMTLIGERGDAARLEAAGFSAYLTKPVKQSVIHDCIVTLLSGDAANQTAAEPKIMTRHSIVEEMQRRLNILVADDDDINRRLAMEILARLGYQADFVVNGQEAVEAVKEKRYHLILMDCQMPVLDGYAATRKIREMLGEEKEIPIIAMTAYAMAGDEEKCMAAGMSDYIAKPINPQEMMKKIVHWTTMDNKSLEVLPVKSEKPSRAEIFNRTALLDRMMGDEQLAKKIIDRYLLDLPVQIGQLKNAIKDADGDKIRFIGHRIRGAAMNLSAPALQEVALEMETAGKIGDFPKAAALFDRIERRFNTLKVVLLE